MLHGSVSDHSGAVIPSATVTLSGGGSERSVVTAADGSYSFAGLAPGQYTVRVAFPGFVPFEQSVKLGTGNSFALPIQLTIGAERQSVTVQGEPGPTLSLEPDNNISAIVVQGEDLDALPDDPDDLAQMLQTLAGPSAGPNGGQLYVDGFSGAQLPPKSSIREIRINQNPFSAEYDRLGWGRIEVLTKPGTDKLHGGFSLNDSDSLFNSRNPYAANKADYVLRFVNANISGAAGKRASFFFNFFDRTINTDALIHAVTLDQTTLQPLPIQSTVVTPRHNYSLNPRLDVQLGGGNTLTLRYQYQPATFENQGIGQYSLVSRAYAGGSNYQDLQSTLTTVLSPTAVNDLKFEYSRNTGHNDGSNAVPAVIVTAAFSGGGDQVGMASSVRNHFEILNGTSVGHGAHTFRFGVRARHDSVSDTSPGNFGGTFTFFGAANAPVLDATNNVIIDPATGRPETASIDSLEQYRRTLLFQRLGDSPDQVRALGGGASQFAIAGGNPLAAISQTDIGLYAQDDWRARPNLTISLGLRYETQTNIHDFRDVAPRIGIAWAPKGRNGQQPKTVIRGGFGMFYDRVADNLSLQALRFNGITEQQYLVVNPDFYPAIRLPASLQAARQPSNRYQFDKSLRAPASLMGAVSLERQLTRRVSAAATYMVMHSEHALRTVNINTPLPGTYDPSNPASGLRPYGNGNIFQYESNGVSNFSQVMGSLNTRFNNRVSLNVFYFAASAKDDVENTGMPSNPYNFKQDYGRAGWALKYGSNMMGSFLAPLGLRFNPMIVFFSGLPYDLTIGRDLNGDTIANDRPAFATDLTRPSVVFTRFGAFDTAPLPGQTLVPRNYLVGNPMWNFNCRVGRTFAFGTVKKGSRGVAGTDAGFQAGSAAMGAAQPQGPAGGEKRFSLNVNLYVNNVFNHLNRGGWVGNLSSPLFGQSTAIYLQRETSNDRMVQLGTELRF
jgi:hypothetical protein